MKYTVAQLTEGPEMEEEVVTTTEVPVQVVDPVSPEAFQGYFGQGFSYLVVTALAVPLLKYIWDHVGKKTEGRQVEETREHELTMAHFNLTKDTQQRLLDLAMTLPGRLTSIENQLNVLSAKHQEQEALLAQLMAELSVNTNRPSSVANAAASRQSKNLQFQPVPTSGLPAGTAFYQGQPELVPAQTQAELERIEGLTDRV